MTSNITPEDAEEYSQSLAQIGEGWWRQIAWAFRQDIHTALGMSRREWAEKYHGYIRMPISERREAVAELASEGMSQPEIADTLGVNQATVSRDLHARSESDMQMHDREPDNAMEPQADGLDPESDMQMHDREPDNADEERDGIHALLEGEPDPGDGLIDELESIEDAENGPEPEPEPDKPRIQINEGDEWYTPRWLFNALGIQFSVDVCAPLDQTFSSVPADRHLTIEDDGLSQSWEGTIWCNPPYSKPEPWARRLIHHGDGLLLTHMPMNAGWCVDVWEACDAIRLFHKRKAEIEAVIPAARPHYCCHAYVSNDRTRLLSAGIARMADVVAAVDARVGRLMPPNRDGSQGWAVPWSALKARGVPVRTYPSERDGRAA